MFSFQLYERMNVADALVSRTYEDGDQIIKQVSFKGLCLSRSLYVCPSVCSCLSISVSLFFYAIVF